MSSAVARIIDAGAGADTIHVGGFGTGFDVAVTGNGGSGNDTINLSALGAGTPGAVSLNGDEEDDTFNLGFTVAAGATVEIGGGDQSADDTLNFNTEGESVTDSGTQLAAAGMNPVKYRGIESFDLTAKPEIIVYNGADTASPIIQNGVTVADFGATPCKTAVNRVFTIENTGNAALTLSALVLPDRFTLVGDFPVVVSPGRIAAFEIQFDGLLAGPSGGVVGFNHNDPVDDPFGFDVFGLIDDDIAPEVLVQNITVQLDSAGQASITAEQIDLGSNDNCDIATLSVDITSFTCANVGPNPVVLTVTDVNGNISTANATVTVEESIAPVIVQPADITVDNDPGQCGAIVQFDIAATDNCPDAAIAYLVSDGAIGNDIFDGALGMDFDVSEPIILTKLGVFDSGSDGLNVTLIAHLYDRSNPFAPLGTLTFTPEAPGVLNGGSRFLDLHAPLVLPSGFQGTIVAEGYDAGLEPSGNLGIGLLPISTDDGGGRIRFVGAARFGSAGSFPGTIDSGPANRYAAGTLAFKAAVSPDIAIVSSPPPGSTFPVGTTFVTTTATDPSGNVSAASFNVTVVDSEAPAVACQDISVQLDANGSASISAQDLDDGSSDNCGIAELTIDRSTFNCLDVGTVPVTLTVTDIHGNEASCIANVTVFDNVAPVAVAQNITALLDTGGNSTINPSAIDNGSTDACGIAGLSLDVTSFTCANVGPNNVTLTVTDTNGNSSEATVIVTVVDIVAPDVSTQNVTVELDADGNASVTIAAIDSGSHDACGIDSLRLDITSFTCADLGANTVTLTAIDVNGNAKSAEATVTVLDVTAPRLVLNGPDEIIILQWNTYNELSAATADQCDSDVPVIVGGDPVDTNGVGVYVVTYDAVDESGNAASQLKRTVRVLPPFSIADALVGFNEVDLDFAARVTGDVVSQKRLIHGNNTVVTGFARNVTGNAELKNSAQVSGNLEVVGEVTLNNDAVVGADVVSGGNVELKNRAQVVGRRFDCIGQSAHASHRHSRWNDHGECTVSGV